MEYAFMMFETLGYHSCRCEGTKEELMRKVPFLSKPRGQWLGRGYYLWTDSPRWAYAWRKDGEQIAISEFQISLDKSDLLDLIGCLNHQILFESILKRFEDRFSKPKEKISVSAVMQWLLEEREKPNKFGIFPYWGVRAKDARCERRIVFLKYRDESMSLVERHQICIYPKFKDRSLTFKKFIHPEELLTDIVEA